MGVCPLVGIDLKGWVWWMGWPRMPILKAYI